MIKRRVKKRPMIKSLFFISIIVMTIIYPFVLADDQGKGKGKGKGKAKGHDDQSPKETIYASVMYDPLLILVEGATSMPLGTEGLEIGLYEEGIFVQFLYTDATSTISFSVDLTKSYTIRVEQGASYTEFAIDLTNANDFLIGGWDIDLDLYIGGAPLTDTIDIFIWQAGSWFDVGDFFIFDSFQNVVFPIGTFGIISPLIADIYNFEVLQTNIEPMTVTLDVLEKMCSQIPLKNLGINRVNFSLIC